MKCEQCGLKIYENKDGVVGYCQGHDLADQIGTRLKDDYMEFLRDNGIITE